MYTHATAGGISAARPLWLRSSIFISEPHVQGLASRRVTDSALLLTIVLIRWHLPFVFMLVSKFLHDRFPLDLKMGVEIPPSLLPYLLGEKTDYSSLQQSLLIVNIVFIVTIVVTTGLRVIVRYQIRAGGLDDGKHPIGSLRMPTYFL